MAQLHFDSRGDEEEPLACLALDYGFCPSCYEVAGWLPYEAYKDDSSSLVYIHLECGTCGEQGTVELTRVVAESTP